MQDNENRPYQQCTRCIMDTTDPEISFDEKGQCNHCTEYFRLAPLYIYNGEETDRAREALIAKIKEAGKNSDYDCMVGVSGGVDSTYVAYMAKKFGLRILAFHFDNGWNSELAVKNVENIVKKLDIDYQTWVVDWEEFRDLQISFLKASVANAVKHLKGIHKLFGKTKFKTYPLLGFNREFYYTYVKKIKMVRLLNYIPYVKEDAMKVIQDELGWVYYGGKHYESVFTRFFQAYYLPHKFGYDKRLAHLSTLICSGQMTREQALEEMKKDTYPPELLAEDKEYVIKKLGMNAEEFEAILNAPPKSYKEYPNDEKRLKFIYKVYNKLRGR